MTMTTTVLYRTGAGRTPAARIWAVLSSFLMKIAHANIRANSAEPFGL
jgi:hypothetical protein